jgi:hypothetical protein
MSLPPNRNYLKETKATNVYFETGIYHGDSIQQAIDAGFTKIIGIDNDKECVDLCKKRFNNKVQIHLADSATDLLDLIKDINEPVTFFLDAHWQMLESMPPGKNPFPLLDEIKQIKKHHLNPDHQIIIDDWYIFFDELIASGNPKHVYGRDEIRTLLKDSRYHTFKTVANPIVNGIFHASK